MTGLNRILKIERATGGVRVLEKSYQSQPKNRICEYSKLDEERIWCRKLKKPAVITVCGTCPDYVSR